MPASAPRSDAPGDAAAPPAPPPGPWSPLREPNFRALWLAILAGNIGTWVHDVAATWVMAERTGSAFMVAAVQAATTLPVVLLAIFAGALADIVDRRRYLLLMQAWMLGVAAVLALLAWAGMLGPWLLIGLSLALGTGAAMALPAQQAITPELVPKPLLGPAVALGSLGINIARSIGPALGGVIVARWGAAYAFALNALSFLVIAVVLWRWKRAQTPSALPMERFGGALRAGLRYARHAPALRQVLARAALFFTFASAATALLPMLVQRDLGAGPGSYGLLLGCIGIGAIAGALLLPRIRARIGADRLVLLCTLGYAGGMLALATLRAMPALYLTALASGLCWICVLSSLHVAAQSATPAWVRGRALSLYIVVFSAGMTAGSLGWGALAEYSNVATALIAAAVCTALAAVVGMRFPLAAATAVDTMPSGHWPQPLAPAHGEAQDSGPVLVTLEYTLDAVLDPQQRASFLRHMHALGRSRRRDGALRWDLMQDTEAPERFLESFIVGSWLEHLRQHARVTREEQRLQAEIQSLLAAGTTPRVRHFIAPGAPDAAPVTLRHDHHDHHHSHGDGRAEKH